MAERHFSVPRNDIVTALMRLIPAVLEFGHIAVQENPPFCQARAALSG
jgi:hypothetical protein